MDNSLHEKKRIIDYWSFIEMFIPQSVPGYKAKSELPIYKAFSDIDLPWNKDHDFSRRIADKNRLEPEYVYKGRYQVYCGVFKLEKVFSILEKALEIKDEGFKEDTGLDDEICIFCFFVNDKGRPEEGSFVLSSCAWIASQTISPGPRNDNWLKGRTGKGFKGDENYYRERFINKCAAISLDKPLTFDVLQVLIKDINEKLGILDDDVFEIRIKCHERREKVIKGEKEKASISKFYSYSPAFTRSALEISKIIAMISAINRFLENKKCSVEFKKDDGLIAVYIHPYYDMEYINTAVDLNSFYFDDLRYVANQVGIGNVGLGLKKYLSSEDEIDLSQRIDISQDHRLVFKTLSPRLFPYARWPSPGHFPLVFSQQFAVNKTMDTFRENEAGIFSINGPPGTGKTTLFRDIIAAVIVERAIVISQLSDPRKALKGKRQFTKLDNEPRFVSIWDEKLQGYEMVLASNNNGAVENVTLEIPAIEAIDSSWIDKIDYYSEYSSVLIGQKSWGLCAARLGNKTNRNDFEKKFWWGEKEEPGFENYLRGISEKENAYEIHIDLWNRAVEEFNLALKKENELREKYHKIYERILDYKETNEEIKKLEFELRYKRNKKEKLIKQKEALSQEKDLYCAEIEKLMSEHKEHWKYQPGLALTIFTLGKALRKWKAKNEEFEAGIEGNRAKINELEAQMNVLEQKIQASEWKENDAEVRLQADETIRDKIYESIKKTRIGHDEYIPPIDDWEDNDPRIELSSPWATPEWKEARSNLFIQALNLHEAFISVNSVEIKNNFYALLDLLKNNIFWGDIEGKEQIFQSVWTTLFLVIPVVSTTFASLGRLFSLLGRESIGWLLIDEAGQVTPQAAVGGIWRAKRTVVVGDPLQLEPIMNVPLSIQDALRKYVGVDKEWIPMRKSVQYFADRANTCGMYTTENNLWIGSPLKVHRRCDRLMFDISNTIAYDGRMVFGTPNREELDIFPSAWFNVKSNIADGNWIPLEGKVVEGIIRKILTQGADPKDIFIISPFRDVINKISRITKKYKCNAPGTVHTVQGKESNIVILVLGGNPDRPGAKGWASQKPNLLNVAISRAKRRIYVVGNREEWRKYRFFSDCASMLDTIDIEVFDSLDKTKPAVEEAEDKRFNNSKLFVGLRTLQNDLVKSKSEVIIADRLTFAGLKYVYEKPLKLDDRPVKPDFTIHYRGITWYWEHAGMLGDPAYKSKWEKKLEAYRRYGICDTEINKKGVLLITEERTGKDLDVSKILEKIDIIKGIKDLPKTRNDTTTTIEDEDIDLPRGYY